MRNLKALTLATVGICIALTVSCAKSVYAKNASWKEIRTELIELRSKFTDSKLSFDQRIDLMPRTNLLLSTMQDLKYTPAENKERIRLVVSVIAATSEIDVARSNTDVLYSDFARHKDIYLKEIRALKSPKKKQAVLLGFKQWEEVGDSPDDPVGSPAIKPKSDGPEED